MTMVRDEINTVHQIWLQGEDKLPPKYKIYSDKYRELNSYVLWDDKKIRKLINLHYPHLLDIYNGYDFWVMKVDLSKYIILHRYGGFYVDMDTEPKKCFHAMAVVANDKPLFYLKKFPKYLQIVLGDYLNNNFMYSPRPRHPLFTLFIKRAQQSAPRLFFDLKIYYILSSIGPHFMMNVIREYLDDGGDITLLTEKATEDFFQDEEAVSWLKKEWVDKQDKCIIISGIILLILLYMTIN